MKERVEKERKLAGRVCKVESFSLKAKSRLDALMLTHY
jgi:hypothetical protein